MASRQATKRLNKEYKSIQANPPPYIIAHPSEDNILEWHYVLTGPQDTPYEGGQYHGLLRFPPQYPFQPPSILMITLVDDLNPILVFVYQCQIIILILESSMVSSDDFNRDVIIFHW